MSARKIDVYSTSKLAAKILVSGIFLILVFRKADLSVLLNYRGTTLLMLLPLITILYLASKFFSATRQYFLIRNEGFEISRKVNLRLYWMGMYYNMLLPGGIGGDAVKGFWMRKNLQMTAKKVLRILLLDRISGLMVLMQLLCLVAFLQQWNVWTINGTEWLLALSVSWLGFYIAHYLLSRRNLIGMWQGWWLSLMVQLIQMLEVLCIVWILEPNSVQTGPFLLAFLFSSVAASIPVSIAGIGIREYCFLLIAGYFELPAQMCVLVSLLFFVSTLLASIPGVFLRTASSAPVVPAS